MISDKIIIVLFRRIYHDLFDRIQKQRPSISKDFLIVCLESSSIFSHFERLSSSVAAVVNSAILKSGLDEISNEVADEVDVFVKSSYPVYERWVNLSIQSFSDSICQLYDALKEDESAIRATFGIKEPLMPSAVNFNLGDSHRGNKAVLSLEYLDGKRLVYKPRNISIDNHFAQLLDYIQNCTGFSFRLPKMIVSKEHGWVEFIQYRECAKLVDVQDYYNRLGGMLAILYSLNATDFHYENIICDGSYPVLIDLESFFVPYIPIEASETSKILFESVLSTGMLPSSIILNQNEETQGKYTPEISGVIEVEGQDGLTEDMQIAFDDNGEISITRVRGKLRGANNVPIYKGNKVQAKDYSSSIVGGFESIYSFIATNKNQYIEQLKRFRGDVVRVLLRDTVAYTHLLREANNVNVLKSESELRAMFSEWLNLTVPEFTFLGRVVTNEVNDLVNRDIPLFTTKVDSKNLWYGENSYIADCFDETGFDRAIRKIARMDSNDCEKQKWLIETSLNYEKKAMFDEQSSVIISMEYSDISENNDKLKGIASSVFNYIKNHIQETEDSVSWLTVHAGNYSNSRIQIFDSSYDLFTGMPGEILFMAYYDKLFGSLSANRLATKAYFSLKGTIEQKIESIKVLGLYKGWGSILFLNTALFQLTGNEMYLQTNQRYFDIINFPQLIEEDRSFGVIKGCAGFILSCLDYYKVSKCRKALDVAVMAGDCLLRKSCPDVEVGMGWRIASRHPLSGYSHGASGFALAFLRLFEQTGDMKYFNASSKIIDYEDSTYDDTYKNWRDLRDHVVREKDELPFLTAWSHGAGGIGLTRLEMLKSGLFDSDPRIIRDLKIALETTLSFGFTDDFSLAVGSFGNIELIHNYLEQYDNLEMRTKYNSIIDAIYRMYAENGYHTCFPIKSLGLMAGITGIGYESLRLLKPDIVKSVLIL